MAFKLRPEIDKPIYYVHVVLIAIVVLGILKYVFGHDMFTFDFIWKLSLAVVIADIMAHSLLRLD